MRVANALSRNLEVWWRTKNNHEPVRDSAKERRPDRRGPAYRGKPGSRSASKVVIRFTAELAICTSPLRR